MEPPCLPPPAEPGDDDGPATVTPARCLRQAVAHHYLPAGHRPEYLLTVDDEGKLAGHDEHVHLLG